MTLDSSSREANFRDSIRKYLIDNIYTIEGIEVLFDKGLAKPDLQDIPSGTDRWVAPLFSNVYHDTLTTFFVELYLCTRKDSEGFRLAQLRDTVYNYLVDTTKPDGARRIPLYRSHPTDPWVQIGAVLVMVDFETGVMVAEDGTKFKRITLKMIWGAKE